MKYLIILLSFVLLSCGSRKVERYNKSSLEESSTTIQEQTEIKEIQFDRKKLFELVRELNIRNGSITIHPDGSITAQGDEINSKANEKQLEQEGVKSKEQITDLDINQDSKSQDDENGVKIDQKQFNWFAMIVQFWPLFLLLFLCVMYKYRQLILNLFKKPTL
ncbi:hypothetical protein HX004_13970 [Myroides sp. 1354]|uniref:hypothetical protein n=1 Tax=unclassified Myroides TaxID=2642485 RepID=UPI002578423B|nr:MULTISPECIES: hypothetical protein [unclassified Myroides]MDM1045861.1 hypothetical protein [Myroides sp. R163-1]MDM1056871.1 hypothetical protein [Myroides sp. 1354]MDM1070066.1 hypothetical protein [Myroides sp. 1372]